MNRPKQLWWGLLVAFAMLSCAACSDDPRVAPSVKRDLSRAGTRAPIDIPLRPLTLATQEGYDAFEQEYLTTLGRDRLIAVYTALAQGGDPTRAVDALLLQRLALLELAASTRSERLQRVFRWADKLRTTAPESPHTIYLLGYIKEILLQVGRGDGSFRLDSRNRDIAEKLLADWDRLLQLAPNYVGPHGSTASAIGRQRQRLASVLRRPQVTPAKPLAPKGQREATAGELQARTDLWRFEHGSDNERNTLCVERDERGDAGGRSELELWIDLRCAALQGNAEPAAKLLQTLGDRIDEISRCKLARQVQAVALRWGRKIPDALLAMTKACDAEGRDRPSVAP